MSEDNVEIKTNGKDEIELNSHDAKQEAKSKSRSRSKSKEKKPQRSRSRSKSKERSRSREREEKPTRRRSRSRGRSPHNNPERDRERANSKTLFIGNLSYNIRERELYDIMRRYGSVRNVTVGYNRRTGGSRGYAFVEFESRRDAEDAFSKFQGYSLDGRRLRLDWDVGMERKTKERGNTTRRRNSPRRRRHSRSRSPRRRSRSRERRQKSKSRDRSPEKKKIEREVEVFHHMIKRKILKLILHMRRNKELILRKHV